MTSTLEYSYISDGFSIRVNESLINRAVRVKSIVRDKLKRVYNKNVALETTEVEQPNIGVENVEGDTLFDLSEERLNDLNDKLNALQIQSSVPCVSNRAVLFTKALVAKIEGVSKKWFKNMPDIKKEDATVEMPTVEENSVVSGIIPGTWDDVESVNKEEVQKEAPTIETEVSVPEVEVPEPQVEISMPNFETEPSNEVEGNYEIPSFIPNMDELVPSNNDSVVENEEETPQEEFVPEPKQVDVVEERELVSEPTTIVSEEPEIPAVEVAEPTVIPTTEVEQETSHEEVSNEHTENEPDVEKKMTIEEKIAQLIERKTQNHSEGDVEVRVVNEQEPSEEEDKKLETKPELTQAGIIAKLQRLNNIMKDKDATIRTLTAKNDNSREELAQAREKISGYEAVVNDLTVKNNSLAQENERLAQKVSDAETASQSTIARLESQVSELTESKTDEAEKFRKIISELKEKHASELSEIKERHAAELKSVTDTKEKQIQAIYATITEALGETPIEEDYGRSMAA